jgi:hypothetical protein
MSRDAARGELEPRCGQFTLTDQIRCHGPLTIGIIGYSTLPIMTAIHLLEKIQKFKTAIFVRFQELASSNDHHDERQAIHDALSTIRALKKETLSHPD